MVDTLARRLKAGCDADQTTASWEGFLLATMRAIRSRNLSRPATLVRCRPQGTHSYAADAVVPVYVGLFGGPCMKPISLALALVCFTTFAAPASAQNPGHGRGADKADKGGPKTAGQDGPGQGRGQGPDKVQSPGNPGQGAAGAAPGNGPNPASAPAVIVRIATGRRSTATINRCTQRAIARPVSRRRTTAVCPRVRPRSSGQSASRCRPASLSMRCPDPSSASLRRRPLATSMYASPTTSCSWPSARG